jgi:HD-GYP domain-containing protein (c-di-GMP phosphodiesterase class II)
MRVRLYIVILVALATALTVTFLAMGGLPGVWNLLLVVAFAALIALAARFPLHFDFKNNVILDTGLIYTAVLLLPPGQAMIAAGCGAFCGHLIRRADPIENAFNSSQTMLQAGMAGLALLAFGWAPSATSFSTAADLFPPVVAAASIYLTNTLLVAGVIALQSGLSPFAIWWESLTRHDGLEQISQFILALIAAVLAEINVWLVPLLGVPLFTVFIAVQRQSRLRFETIFAVEMLADLVDRRDPYTANHSRSVAAYAREIATRMQLGTEAITLIERAGRVHDLGKIVIDRSLLAKPGKLTDEEWAIFEEHPVVGAEILDAFDDFRSGTALVRSHHERMDGNGYPDRLSGEAIPLGARILAVADAFDAMASARPYRPGLPREVVLSELANGRGTHWDARVVDTLLELIAEGRIRFTDQRDHPQVIDGVDRPAPQRRVA